MTDLSDPGFEPSVNAYSPQRRTALLLTGTGTAGAYHAGVLRGLHEAGVKIDVVAGHGIGAVGALFAAVDGAQRLWDDKGFWRASPVAALYPWRRLLRFTAWALFASFLIVTVPVGVIALGLAVFPVDFVLRTAGAGGSAGLVGVYLRAVQAAFAPDALPVWLPRLVFLVLGMVTVAAAASAWGRTGRRRSRGRFWWRVLRPPLSSREAIDHCWRTMWDLIRGATSLKQPTTLDLARRYTEMLAENLGQPGFRELLLTVHDLDAHRDLVFVLAAEARRRNLTRRPTTEDVEARRAEVFDLSGGFGRDHLSDALAGALSIPMMTEPHAIAFSPDGYWRGETHRICSRPDGVARGLEELSSLGVEQVILVSAAPESAGPHALTAPRLDGRGRMGEHLQSSEAAAVRDVVRCGEGSKPRIFPIRPSENPLGPFDFAGGFDDRSDRPLSLGELLARGYQDVYQQFIEPVVAAGGERVGLRL
jgi:hypothetical protein